MIAEADAKVGAGGHFPKRPASSHPPGASHDKHLERTGRLAHRPTPSSKPWKQDSEAARETVSSSWESTGTDGTDGTDGADGKPL